MLLSIWFKQFLLVLAGVIPITLLLGGALALYLGFDELKDTWKKDDTVSPAVQEDDIQTYKSEINDLKKELDELKAAKA